MKTMDELVLDRLIEEATRPIKAALEKATQDLIIAQQSARNHMQAQVKETEWRQKLQKEAAEAEKPLLDMFNAADEVRMASQRDTARIVLRQLISKMSSAMTVAEKHICFIPF